MADEIASSRPAAVDSAAAKPPAAIRPITHGGSCAISGFARTKISALTSSSLPAHPALAKRPSSSASCAIRAVPTAAVAAATLPPSV